MKTKNPKFLLILIVLSIFLMRIPLFNKDARYFFGDEIFYKRLIITLQESERTNNPLLFWQGVFGINAKPGYGILYSLPIWLETQKPNIPSGAILNMFINSSMILLVFLILKKLLDTQTAVIATLVVIFSISSVIYIRHMLPYDASLTILLLALYTYLRSKSNFFFGVLSAFSFLIYPSYFYYFVPIPLLIFVFNKFKFKPTLLFSIGFAVIILFAQIFSLLIGASPSYFVEAQQLSGVVTQGDFMPALSFLTAYVELYDGVWGLILIIFAPLIIFLKNKKFFALGVYLVLAFLILEMFSHIAAKTVLYGRTIRPFYLLLLISGVIVLENFLKKASKEFNLRYYFIYGLFVLTAFINWWPNFNTFKDLVYPDNFRQEAKEYLLIMYGEYAVEDLYTKKETTNDSTTDPPILISGRFYLTNPTLLYPYYGNLDPPCKEEVLIEREHTLLFKPYRYEGFTKDMREYLTLDPPKYKLIYCRK